MTDKEIRKIWKKHFDCKLEDNSVFGLNTPKQRYLTMNFIADIENRRFEIVKVTPKKCETKMFSKSNGLCMNFYNVRDYYDEDLNHIKKNIRIIEFDIL